MDGNIVFSWRGKGVTVSNRARIQKEFIATPGGRYSELVFRDRIKAAFRTDRRLQPFVGGEIFAGLDELGESENKYRLTGGLDYDLTKKATFSIFYHYQQEWGEATNESAHIVAARFYYTF